MGVTRGAVEQMFDKAMDDAKGQYSVTNSAKSRMLMLCDLADELKEKNGYGEIGVHIDPDLKHGVITFDTDELILYDGKKDGVFEYLRVSDYLSFSKLSNEDMRISFGVKDLWSEV